MSEPNRHTDKARVDQLVAQAADRCKVELPRVILSEGGVFGAPVSITGGALDVSFEAVDKLTDAELKFGLTHALLLSKHRQKADLIEKVFMWPLAATLVLIWFWRSKSSLPWHVPALWAIGALALIVIISWSILQTRVIGKLQLATLEITRDLEAARGYLTQLNDLLKLPPVINKRVRRQRPNFAQLEAKAKSLGLVESE